MVCLTIQQRLEIVKNYYQNVSTVREPFRALRPVFGVHNRPSERTNDRKNIGNFIDDNLADFAEGPGDFILTKLC